MIKLKNKNFYTICLGCKVNLFEINAITNDLIKAKYKQVDDINRASIVVINSCSVTNHADAKSRNMISKAIHAKLKPIVIVLGCYSQTNDLKSNNLKPHIITGASNKNKVVELLQQYLKTGKQINKTESLNKIIKFENLNSQVFLNNTRAFLKIQDGCNFMCSYCLIPYSRGKQRSKDHNLVLDEINNLVSKNYKEIVLTGVNTAGYNDNGYSFFDLLKDIDKLSGDFRVRISSIEPFQITYEIIDLLANNPNRWAKQIHLCLQAANNKTLKEMNRKYTMKYFFSLVRYIRKKIKNASVTTDYIVGFTSETDKDFNTSLKNLKKLKLSNMNIFPYSRRDKTAASIKYPNDIDSLIMKQRLNKVIDLNNKNKISYLKKIIKTKKSLKVLVEKTKTQGYYQGYSSEFIKVYFKCDKLLNSNCFIDIIPKSIFLNGILGE